MPTVTLLAKAYNSFQVKELYATLKSTFKDLKVKFEVCGVTNRDWIQLSVSGEDENVTLHYMDDKIGFCPTNLESVRKFSTIHGRVIGLDKNRNELCVDIGVFSPDPVDAAVSLPRLQAQLADGRKISLGKLVELFGLCKNLPLSIKVLSVDSDRSRIEAELAEAQQDQYGDWTRSLLDRLQIIGASYGEIKSALAKTGFNRDVVAIEALGTFEYSMVCKLGTDAAGLIPRLGKNLGKAAFTIFNPRKVIEFFGEE
jgi:hypothetical protein